MAITDHVAILAHAALDEMRANKKKIDKRTQQPRMEYYAVLCYPPSAANDLLALAASAAPGGSINGLGSVGAKRNDKRASPIPGIPGDWLIARTSTQYAPTLLNQQAQVIDPLKDKMAIRATFTPGRRVRASLSAFYWANDGAGVSFNPLTIMDAGEGERLNIGTAGDTTDFSKYVSAPAADASDAAPVAAAPVAASNPFQQAATPSANPFG